MSNFLLPTKVEFQTSDELNKGSVIVSPCYHGYGTTLGNSLRRVLLSSLPGSAVEAFKINGVQHEFGAVPGVKEDVVEIILNLKQLHVKVFSEEEVTLKISKKGKGEVTAKDFEDNAEAEVINTDLHIATITEDKPFEMEIHIGKGLGFKPVEDKDKQTYGLGTVLIDSDYNPILDVGYDVEYTRVGDVTDYEKLTLKIETDGTIDPQTALRETVKILMDHYTILNENIESEPEVKVKETKVKKAVKKKAETKTKKKTK